MKVVQLTLCAISMLLIGAHQQEMKTWLVDVIKTDRTNHLSIMKHEYAPFRLQEPSLMLIVLSELFTYPNTFLRPVATGVQISEDALY